MFLVQLGALALRGARSDDLPEDEGDWAEALRGLAPNHADDAPWRLVAVEPDKPAFLQAPEPAGLKWSTVATPDALDMLITARNHDLKQSMAKQATAEDWVYALVSLQTCEGYGGRDPSVGGGYNGIARMNGGSSSRPMLGLAPSRDRDTSDEDTSVDPSSWWARDVRRLSAQRALGPENGIGLEGGPALLWCLDWPEGEQLDLHDLDPWFIEICRRVRLTEAGDVISARRSTSKAARIDARAFKGNVGDPWTPVHKTEGKSLTLGHGDFDYARLCDLLFSGNWKVPLLAQPGNEETEDMLLVAEALARGNSKTEGFKSRIVLVPGKAVPLFSSETVATLSKAQMEEIKGFDAAIRYALALMAAGGNRDQKAIKKHHYVLTISSRVRFNRAADRLFFPSLWRRVAAESQSDDALFEAKHAFLDNLMKAAKAELQTALPAIPCATLLRPRAEARAWRAFMGTLRGKDACRVLFNREEVNAAA